MTGFNFEFVMKNGFSNSDLEIFIQVKGFTPSRKAPPCSNHDSPAYSDCGDNAEFDDYSASLIIVSSSGKVFFLPLPDELHDMLEIKITEEIFKRESFFLALARGIARYSGNKNHRGNFQAW